MIQLKSRPSMANISGRFSSSGVYFPQELIETKNQLKDIQQVTGVRPQTVILFSLLPGDQINPILLL